MAKQDYSKYQKKIIDNYYHNMDTIMLQKLGEMVTELYLAESDKKREKLWERVEKAMMNLKVPEKIAANIMEKRDIEVLAKNLNIWLTGSGKPKR